MGMVVRSNIMAMNANRQLGVNNSSVSKNLEKLSSGFKINRAGDDASGLAISEKMKAQIKGLETASANSQDGISLVQTAEGALTEVHDMLNRMVELATKSANGTIQDEVDREAIQSEVDALNEEIDRISQSTNFNGINLLDGSLSATGSNKTISTIKTDLATIDIDATAGSFVMAAPLDAAPTADGDTVTYTVALDNGKSYTVDFTFKDDGTTAKLVDANGKEYRATQGGATAGEIGTALTSALKEKMGNNFKISDDGNGTLTFDAVEKGTGAPSVVGLTQGSNIGGTVTDPTAIAITPTAATDAKTGIADGTFVAYDGTNVDDAVFEINGKKFVMADTTTIDVSKLDKNITVVSGVVAANDDAIAQQLSKATGMNVVHNADMDGNGTAGFTFSAGTATGSKGGLTLQIGDTGDDFNHVTVSVDDMSAKGLGTNGLDVSNQDAAKSSIDTIKAAINKVSTNRADLGALQNRLEHTINNLDVAAENMSAANSRIRDTDMAKQMMEYTKMNVLTQAAQAMLAQANQQPQSILQLLQ